MSKFTITFKTPDAVEDAIRDLPEEERAKACWVCARWFQYDEYCYVEVDTDNDTVRVLRP